MKQYEYIFLQIEQDDLRNETVKLVRENKALSSYIKQILHNNEDSPTKKTHQENDLIENLKTQIQLLMKAMLLINIKECQFNNSNYVTGERIDDRTMEKLLEYNRLFGRRTKVCAMMYLGMLACLFQLEIQTF